MCPHWVKDKFCFVYINSVSICYARLKFDIVCSPEQNEKVQNFERSQNFL
jgi:hypothetical protein